MGKIISVFLIICFFSLSLNQIAFAQYEAASEEFARAVTTALGDTGIVLRYFQGASVGGFAIVKDGMTVYVTPHSFLLSSAVGVGVAAWEALQYIFYYYSQQALKVALDLSRALVALEEALGIQLPRLSFGFIAPELLVTLAGLGTIIAVLITTYNHLPKACKSKFEPRKIDLENKINFFTTCFTVPAEERSPDCPPPADAERLVASLQLDLNRLLLDMQRCAHAARPFQEHDRTLLVTVSGKGKVRIANSLESPEFYCESNGGINSCLATYHQGAVASLRADDTDPSWEFNLWGVTDPFPCTDRNSRTCVFNMNLDTSKSAYFAIKRGGSTECSTPPCPIQALVPTRRSFRAPTRRAQSKPPARPFIQRFLGLTNIRLLFGSY